VVQTKENFPAGLSVLILAHNEEKTIEACLRQVADVCRGMPFPFEMIVVNDGSQDQTAEIAERVMSELRSQRVPDDKYEQMRIVTNPKNLGYGGAYKAGVMAARFASCVSVGAVNAIQKASLAHIFSHSGRKDMILSYIANPEVRPPLRRLISRNWVRLLNFLFGYDLKFYHGCNIYPTAHLRAVDISNTHAFFIDILIPFLMKGLTYEMVPMVLQPRLDDSKSSTFKLKNVLSVLRALARHWWAHCLYRNPCRSKKHGDYLT
jgi:glycosyltransferase involved in cell wall biosynthesis